MLKVPEVDPVWHWIHQKDLPRGNPISANLGHTIFNKSFTGNLSAYFNASPAERLFRA